MTSRNKLRLCFHFVLLCAISKGSSGSISIDDVEERIRDLWSDCLGMSRRFGHDNVWSQDLCYRKRLGQLLPEKISGNSKVLCYDEKNIYLKIISILYYSAALIVINGESRPPLAKYIAPITSVVTLDVLESFGDNETLSIDVYFSDGHEYFVGKTSTLRWKRLENPSPSEVDKLSRSAFELEPETNTYYAKFQIETVEGSFCHFDVTKCCDHISMVHYCLDIQPVYLDIEDEFSFSISGLTAENVCDVYVTSISPNNTDISKHIEVRFPCNGDNACYLQPVSDVNVNLTITSSNLFDVAVSWTESTTTPDYYQVHLQLSDSDYNMTVFVSGRNTSAYFREVPIDGDYFVTVTAISGQGVVYNSPQTDYVGFAKPPKMKSKWAYVPLVIGIAALFLIIVIITIAWIAICRRRNRFLDFESDFDSTFPEKKPFELRKPLVEDALELDEKSLTLGELLGEGAFGVVKKGWLHAQAKEVAVKMLKEYPTNEDIKQFYREIETMASVGSHPHVLNLLGFVSTNNNLMIVVEFCSRGDLQNYLRCAWEVMASKHGHRTENVPNGDTFTNRLYHLDGVCDTELTSVDLLSFCRQIAIGMEYLSQNRVVHRDLAARNILICEDKTVKIADFGLSRDIYQENLYKKMGSGKLPIKWMAIESITHQIYTTHSDVWSFGIVMWEIATLGGTPYPDVNQCPKLVKMLLGGYRMPKPSNCSQQLYDVMLSCWQVRPKDRPTFTELYKILDKLLHSECASDYLTLDLDGKYYTNKPNDEGLWKYFKQIARYRAKSQPSSPSVLGESDSEQGLIFRWASTQQPFLNHYSLTPKLGPQTKINEL